eukprot:CAMPEP_0198221918 /NCGR_PEP_ID=MMETSP1445-20131203/85854_1 /TAXON_ID=36898 /ORGANISM="Pyramimonas sp., Strain CCMP2087" /LENGTH=358 /DNA_ID=CAMNT_0043900243 /DNA_START=129 /DNA_END=1202 /DNA_ORIENTATION=+
MLAVAAGASFLLWTARRYHVYQQDLAPELSVQNGPHPGSKRKAPPSVQARLAAATATPPPLDKTCQKGSPPRQHCQNKNQQAESPVGPRPADSITVGNAARLVQYEALMNDFVTEGLDLVAVKSAQGSFALDELMDWPGIWPKLYPVPFPSVRLAVIPLDGGQLNYGGPKLALSLSAIAREITAALTGYNVYVNPRSGYHTSLFYMSHPNDIRPDTTIEGGGDLFQNGGVTVPSADNLAWEHLQVSKLAETTSQITLEVERITFTRAGALLVLFIDASNPSEPQGKPSIVVDTLRERMRNTFPGASIKQPQPIIHGTLLRLLAPCTPLPTTMKAKIVGICDKWTSKLSGDQYSTDRVW